MGRMISLVQVLPVGNALRLFLSLPSGATDWRVLRRLDDAFAGPDDPNAWVVGEGRTPSIVDATGLANGATYWYRQYVLVGGAWVDGGPSASGVPAAIIQDVSTDTQALVRDRLDVGFMVEVQAGRLFPQNGRIQVLTATPAFEDATWPLITVHVGADSSDERWLGEMASPDDFNAADNMWEGYEGWLSRVQLTITTWSLNPDERKAMRQVVKKLVLGNLEVFDDAGLLQIGLSQHDHDDFTSYNAPVFQSINTFSCLASSAVSAVEGVIGNVSVSVSVPG